MPIAPAPAVSLVKAESPLVGLFHLEKDLHGAFLPGHRFHLRQHLRADPAAAGLRRYVEIIQNHHQPAKLQAHRETKREVAKSQTFLLEQINRAERASPQQREDRGGARRGQRMAVFPVEGFCHAQHQGLI